MPIKNLPPLQNLLVKGDPFHLPKKKEAKWSTAGPTVRVDRTGGPRHTGGVA